MKKHRITGHSVIILVSVCLALGALQAGLRLTTQAADGSTPSSDLNNIPTAAVQTATMAVAPATGTFEVGATIPVSITIDGGGQSFNAAQATVAVSGPVTVQSLSLGNCNFTFLLNPTASNPDFSGAILGGATPSCTVYSLLLQVTGIGPISITLSSVQVLEPNGLNPIDILSGLIDGAYTAEGPSTTPTTILATSTSSPTITATPTAIATPRATPAGAVNASTPTVSAGTPSAPATSTATSNPAARTTSPPTAVSPTAPATSIEGTVTTTVTSLPTATATASAAPSRTAIPEVGGPRRLLIHNKPRTVSGGLTTPCDLRSNLKKLSVGCEVLSSVSAPGATVVYTIVYPGRPGQRQAFTDKADFRGHSLHIFDVPYLPPRHAAHGSPATVAQVTVKATLASGAALPTQHTRFVAVR